MTPEKILEVLTDVFRDVFDDKDLNLTRETTANDIEEWDSLNQIKLPWVVKGLLIYGSNRGRSTRCGISEP